MKYLAALMIVISFNAEAGMAKAEPMKIWCSALAHEYSKDEEVGKYYHIFNNCMEVIKPEVTKEEAMAYYKEVNVND